MIILSLSVLRVIFPGKPGLAGYIGAKDDGGGDWWQLEVQEVQSSNHNVTTNKPTPNFLQAGYSSYRPTNSVKALKGNILWSLLARN